MSAGMTEESLATPRPPVPMKRFCARRLISDRNRPETRWSPNIGDPVYADVSSVLGAPAVKCAHCDQIDPHFTSRHVDQPFCQISGLRPARSPIESQQRRIGEHRTRRSMDEGGSYTLESVIVVIMAGAPVPCELPWLGSGDLRQAVMRERDGGDLRDHRQGTRDLPWF